MVKIPLLNNVGRLKKIVALTVCFFMLAGGFSGMFGLASIEPVEGASENETTCLMFDFEEPEIIMNDGFYNVQMSGLDSYGTIGEPVLPIKTIEILLPLGHEIVDINMKSNTQRQIPGNYFVAPGQEEFPFTNVNNQPDKYSDCDRYGNREYYNPQDLWEMRDEEVMVPAEMAFGSHESMWITPPNTALYNSNDVYPAQCFESLGVQSFRGYKILIINLYPVSYIPASGSLSYYKNIELEIVSQMKTSPDADPISLRGLDSDEALIEERISNPSAIGSYTNVETLDSGGENEPTSIVNPADTYEYVIITSNSFLNASGAFNFEGLIASKIVKGISATIVTVEDIYADVDYNGIDAQEEIRNFITDAYNNWETEYILLGGDGDGGNVGGESGDTIIPHRGFYANAYGTIDNDIPADMYYACLDGTFDFDGDGIYGESNDGVGGGEVDLLAEVFIGRAPVDSDTEISNFVMKTLIYEGVVDDYLEEVLMLGELLWADPTWGGDYKDEIAYGCWANPPIPDDFNTSTLYDRDLAGSWLPSDIISIINNDVHIINHLGHSYVDYCMRLYNGDVDSFTNDKYFFGYSQGCYDGAFDNRGSGGSVLSTDCISEHFVCTANGAFAFIGNTRYGWGEHMGTNGSSQFYDRKFFDALFGQDIRELGPANQYSKEQNIGLIDTGAMRWCYYELTLFGDPEVSIKDPTAPDHDVAVDSLDVETHHIQNADTFVNSTILNQGLNNETNVQVNLTLNGATIDNQIIATLVAGTFADISFPWTAPSVEGMYLVGIEIMPVPQENITINNQMFTEVIVGSDIAVTELLIENVINIFEPTNVNATIENVGLVNEVNVSVELLISGSLVDSQTIAVLNAGSSADIQFIWTPLNTGIIGVEVGVVPVFEEGRVDNNAISDSVLVTHIIFKEDVESGQNGWTNNGLWHMSTTRSSPDTSLSPTHSWAYNDGIDYDTGVANSGSIVSPIIDVSWCTDAVLNFKGWYETEGTGTSWDQRWVQISTDGGAFQPIAQLFGDPMLNWNDYEFNITSYLGDTVQLRFFFDTIDPIGNSFEGWYVDDILILGNLLDHDIAVENISAPNLLEPLDNCFVEAEIINTGLNNETNIEVNLMIDGTLENSTIIPSLSAGESNMVGFNWVPTIEGNYTVSVEAVPVANETFVSNNHQTTFIIVKYLPDIWVDPHSYDISVQAGEVYYDTLTVGNNGDGQLFYNITSDASAIESGAGFLFFDDFDGEIEGTSPPANWVTDSVWVPTNCEVDDSQSYSDPHSMYLYDGASLGYVHHDEPEGITEETISASFYIPDNSNEKYFITQAITGSRDVNEILAYIRCDSSYDISYYTGAAWVDTGYYWTEDTWFSLAITHDFDTDTYEIQKDGLTIASNCSMWHSGKASVKSIHFCVNMCGIWIDDIMIEEAAPPQNATGEVFLDDFDGETPGAAPANWTQDMNLPCGTLEIANTFSNSPPNSMRVQYHPSYAGSYTHHDFADTMTETVLELSVYIPSTTGYYYFGTQVTTGDKDNAGLMAYLGFRGDGTIQYNDGAWKDTNHSYTTGWHDLKLIHDYDSDTYDIEYDGTIIYNDAPFWNNGNGVRSIQLGVSRTGSTQMWVDDVVFGEAAPLQSAIGDVMFGEEAPLQNATSWLTISPDFGAIVAAGNTTAQVINETSYITTPADAGFEVTFNTSNAPLLDLSLSMFIPGDQIYLLTQGVDYDVNFTNGQISTIFGGVDEGWEFYSYYNYTASTGSFQNESVVYSTVGDEGDTPWGFYLPHGKITGNVVLNVWYDYSRSGNPSWSVWGDPSWYVGTFVVDNDTGYVTLTDSATWGFPDTMSWWNISAWYNYTIPTGSAVHSIGVNATLLEPGFYRANITVSSNDPDTPEIIIPLNLTVLSAPHDLSVNDILVGGSLEAAKTNWVNGTILNLGFENETDIEVQFLVDGGFENSTIIPVLDSSQQSVVSFEWVSYVEGAHNITIFVVPVAGENITYNNQMSIIVNITAVPDIWINPTWFDFTVEAGTIDSDLLTIGNDGFDFLNYTISTGGPSAGVTLFSDRASFETECPGLPTEDFEGSNVAPNDVEGDFGPFNYLTDNTCYSPGALMEGFSINCIPDTDEMVVVTAGFLGVTSTVVGPNSFVDITNITFPGNDVNCVGFELLGPMGVFNADIDIYGIGDVLLASTTVLTGEFVGQFIGIRSGDIITRIVISDALSSAELVDNLSFGFISEGVDWLSVAPDFGSIEPNSGGGGSSGSFQNESVVYSTVGDEGDTPWGFYLPHGKITGDVSLGVWYDYSRSGNPSWSAWGDPSWYVGTFVVDNDTGYVTLTDSGWWGFPDTMSWWNVSAWYNYTAPTNYANHTTVVNATILGSGFYQANITISSNDPDTPEITIPVNLTVLPPDHDLGVYNLAVPNPAEFNQTCFVNATVTNAGLVGSSEFNFTVDLIIGGAVEDTIVISELVAGEETDISFSWIPGLAGNSTVEVYITPVPGELLIWNNSVSTVVQVIAYPDIWAIPTEFNFTLTAGEVGYDNLTIGNDGFANLFYNITDDLTSYESDNIVQNPSFETGDFTDWFTQDMAAPLDPLMVVPAGYFGWFFPTAPSGNYSVSNGFDGGGPDTIYLAQDLSLPQGVTALSFNYRAAWSNGGTQDRLFTVEIEPYGGGAAMYSVIVLTAAGGTFNSDTGILFDSIDISAFSGDDVRISFEWYIPESYTGPAQFELDNITINNTVGQGDWLSEVPDTGFIPFGGGGSGYFQNESVVYSTDGTEGAAGDGEPPWGFYLPHGNITGDVVLNVWYDYSRSGNPSWSSWGDPSWYVGTFIVDNDTGYVTMTDTWMWWTDTMSWWNISAWYNYTVADDAEHSIIANATMLDPGFYQANITVASNDPDTPEIIIPVNLTVLMPEHDIKLSDMEAPSIIYLGDTGQINATITNQGLSFESVNVWLVEDGNPLFDQVINLDSGFSAPVIFNYTPAAAGTFNVSIYATPVSGESIVYNNIVWMDIEVIAVPDIWAAPLSYDVTIIAGETHSDNLTIGNSGFATLDYVIDTGGRYEEAGTSSVTMADIYDLVSYDSGGDGTNDTFDHIYIEAFSADMDTMDVIVNAWNGIGWVNLYTGLGGGNVVAVDGDFYAEGYTVLEIFIDDWEDNDDIYYDFNYSLKSGGDWLSVIPDTGSLAPSGTFVHTVIMNGSSLAPGFYQANISVQSNDLDEAVILIPVNLTVQPAPHDIAVISLDIDDFVRANEMVSVNVTVSNQGSNDENNVIVEFWVNGILEDTFVIGFISSGSSVLITFDWLPVLEGPNSLMVEALMVPGEINGSNNIQTAIVDVFDPAPILLVDDDGGISSEIWYYDSIIANGYECDVWDTQIDGTPELDFLGLYGIVIWFTGNDFTSSLTLSERGLVSSYLDGGGKLYLSGGLIGYDAFLNGWTTWYEDYLSTLLVNELIFGGQVFNGINLDEIGDGMTLNYCVGDYCTELWEYSSWNEPIAPGTSSFNFDATNYSEMTKVDTGTYKLVYSSFDFAGVDNGATRDLLMYRILNWLGIPDVEPPQHSNENPGIGEVTNNPRPTVWVHVTDNIEVDVSTIRLHVFGFPVFYDLAPIPDGYNVSYTHGGDYLEGSIPVRIVAEDTSGNLLDFTWFWYLDHSPPEAWDIQPPPGSETFDTNPRIELKVTDIGGVELSTLRLYIMSFAVWYEYSAITDGYHVWFDHPTGYSPGDVIECRIVAEDSFGHWLDQSWNFTILETQMMQIPVKVGWNLISCPMILADSSLPNALTDADTSWDTVRFYDSLDMLDHWKSYSTLRPVGLNDMHNVSCDMGIWLHIPDVDSLGDGFIEVNGIMPEARNITLYAGWNLVGYPSLTPSLASDTLPGAVDMIAVYDDAEPGIIRDTTDLSSEMMNCYSGYWVHVTSDTIWFVEP